MDKATVKGLNLDGPGRQLDYCGAHCDLRRQTESCRGPTDEGPINLSRACFLDDVTRWLVANVNPAMTGLSGRSPTLGDQPWSRVNKSQANNSMFLFWPRVADCQLPAADAKSIYEVSAKPAAPFPLARVVGLAQPRVSSSPRNQTFRVAHCLGRSSGLTRPACRLVTAFGSSYPTRARHHGHCLFFHNAAFLCRRYCLTR